jgi:TfoX/Sxy family transcriptional regulator of competence genes
VGFPKPDEKLTAFLEKSLAGYNAELRPMFGCPAWFAGDNMFAGVFGSVINLRIPPGEEQEKIMAAYPGAQRFEPWPGRAMKEHMSLPGEALKAGKKWQGWLKKSYDYAASLPPKKKGKKKG